MASNPATIDSSGKPVAPYVAHYMRYGAECAYEADSLEDALWYLDSGMDDGMLSAGNITDAEGNEVMSIEAVHDERRRLGG